MKANIFFLAGSLLSVQALAQVMIPVRGTVTNVQSFPVRGASVHLLNTNGTVLTNTKGEFHFPHVRPGRYEAAVSAVGYAVSTKEVVVTSGGVYLSFVVQDASVQLDEVIVTADKREQALQRMPQSSTVLSAPDVANYQVWNARELTALVPNFYSADPGDKRNLISLRGITTTSYDPAVATYIDGVNQFGLDTYIPLLFDVDRIEVLRGPQGTLYGRNATGGVVNIITKRPGNKGEAFAELTEGNYGAGRYTAGIRLTLVKDKLFFGAAGLFEKSKGFFVNEVTRSRYDKQEGITGNYYLRYLPRSNWSVTLNVKHNNGRNNGPFPLVYSKAEAFAHPFVVTQNATTKLIDNTANTSVSVNGAGRGFNFISQTSYQSNYRYYTNPIDADFSPFDALTLIDNYGHQWNKVKVLTEELRFSSAGNAALKWITGLYVFGQHNPVKQTTHFGEDAGQVGSTEKNFSLINSTKSRSGGGALFGQATYTRSKWEFTGGLRYDYEKKSQRILGEYQTDADPTLLFPYRQDTAATAHFSALSPKVIAAFHITTHNNVYVSWSKGYRAGGLTPLSSDPSQPPLFTYKPEYSNNIEVGLKNTFGKRLLLNVSAFYTTVTDVQVPTLVLPDAVTITRNTGKLVSKGVEAELAARPLKGLDLNYNIGYTHARYKRLKLAQGGTETDLHGRKQIFTPDFTSLLAAGYSFSPKKRKELHLPLRVEWRYIGNQYFDLANTIEQKGYSLFTVKLGVALKNYSLLFWEKNAGNKTYLNYAYEFGAVHLGDPKTYGITFSARL